MSLERRALDEQDTARRRIVHIDARADDVGAVRDVGGLRLGGTCRVREVDTLVASAGAMRPRGGEDLDLSSPGTHRWRRLVQPPFLFFSFLYLNLSCFETALVPLGVVTVTSTLPLGPAGTTALIAVGEVTS